jgi:hypothetical protein
MAPRTEPDPGLMVKQLRREAGLEEIRKTLEKLRREAPHQKELPTKKPRGKRKPR